MRVLFAGPSLPREPLPAGLVLRAPARRGDLLLALGEGAEAIGLVDGLFGDTPSVGHKEILFALSRGVPVIGGASLGALRAAECAPFGMEAVGAIAAAYVEGRRVEDADVALAHAPAALGSTPLSLALVDAEATLDALAAALDAPRLAALRRAAQALPFAERSWPAIVAAAGEDEALAGWLAARTVGLKAADARLVARRTAEVPVPGPRARFVWTAAFLDDVRRYAPALEASLPVAPS